MPPNEGGTNPPAPAPGPAPAPQPSPAPAPQPAPAPSPAPVPEPTFTREYVESLRQEAASNRVAVKEIRDEFAAFRTEQTSKQADAERKAQEAEQKAQRLSVRSAFLTAATKLGIVHLDDAYTLATADLAKVELDQASGEPKGVEDLVKKLATDKPFLMATGSGASFANPQRGGTPPLDDKTVDMRQQLYGTGHNPFDPVRAKERGGGVRGVDSPVLPQG